MELGLLKEAWAQIGAMGLLIVGGGIIIRTLYRDLTAERKRNADFGERVLTVAVESRKALEADTDAKRGLIDRIDRMARP